MNATITAALGEIAAKILGGDAALHDARQAINPPMTPPEKP